MTLNDEQIVDLLDSYERESKALRNELIKISWYMRGGITYNDAMMLSQNERQMISDLISENLEITKKSGLPFF